MWCNHIGDVGGPNARADDDPFVAGVTVSYRYVSQMAEGKITAKPAIEKLEGNRAYFADGSEEEIDLVVQVMGGTHPTCRSLLYD